MFKRPARMRGIFGAKPKASDDPLRLLAKAKPLPRLWIDCGTEDFLYEDNVRMRDHLRALDYNLVYEEAPGDHQWKYWDEKIQTVLDWLVPGKGEN